ncbi:MAG: C_GCAxxG_C_C family protein [bacterium]|nr:C_GCAxxG_C_C family protein [bacterium]
MSTVEKAVKYFEEGYNCSQSVCTAFAEEMGVERDTSLKMSAGFGGGIGRMGDTCGAVTGAYMALGLKYGPTEADPEAKAKMYEYIREFAEKFKARNESLECRGLLGLDISIPEERDKIHAEKLTAKVCPKFIQDAAEILEEMLYRYSDN